MTREQYIRMTEATRRVADRLPGGAKALARRRCSARRFTAHRFCI